MKKYSKFLLAFLAVNLNTAELEPDKISYCESFARSDVSISSQRSVIDGFQDINDALEKSNNSKKKIAAIKNHLKNVHPFAEQSLLVDLFNYKCLFFYPEDAKSVESKIKNNLEEENKKALNSYLENRGSSPKLSAKEEAMVFHKAIKNAREALCKDKFITNLQEKYENLRLCYCIIVSKLRQYPEIIVSLYDSIGSNRRMFSNTICLNKDTISNCILKAYNPDKEKFQTDLLEITFNKLEDYTEARLFPALITLQFNIAKYNHQNGKEILCQEVTKGNLCVTNRCVDEVVKILSDSNRLPGFLSCLKVIKPYFFLGTYFTRHYNLNPLDCLVDISFPKDNTFYSVYLSNYFRSEVELSNASFANNEACILYNVAASISKLKGLSIKEVFPFLAEYKSLSKETNRIDSSYKEKKNDLKSRIQFLNKKGKTLNEEEKKQLNQLRVQRNALKNVALSKHEKSELGEHKREIKEIKENPYKKEIVSIADKTYSDAFTLSEMTKIVTRQKNIEEDANRFINHEPLEYTKSAIGIIDTTSIKKDKKKNKKKNKNCCSVC